MAKINNVLRWQNRMETLKAISKWGNLTLEQLAILLKCSKMQIINNINKLNPYEYGQENKTKGLICFKKFPHSKTKLYCATGLGLRALKYLKEKKKERGKIVKIPAFQTVFNFYADEHTTLCIKALLKHIGGEFEQDDYLTPRDMLYSWIHIYKDIKEVWGNRIEARQPDLLFQENGERVCIEIENTPKSHMRMIVILRSLYALGDYAKRFNKLIIYANDKDKTYARWRKVASWVEDKPKNLEIRKLSELENPN